MGKSGRALAIHSVISFRFKMIGDMNQPNGELVFSEPILEYNPPHGVHPQVNRWRDGLSSSEREAVNNIIKRVSIQCHGT